MDDKMMNLVLNVWQVQEAIDRWSLKSTFLRENPGDATKEEFEDFLRKERGERPVSQSAHAR